MPSAMLVKPFISCAIKCVVSKPLPKLAMYSSGTFRTRLCGAPFCSISRAFSASGYGDQNDKVTYESLLAENASLRKQLEAMKEKDKKKPGKFLAVIKEYGLPFVLYWTSTYAVTGVGIYFAIENGLLAGTDAIDLIKTVGLDKFIDVERLNPTHGNAVFAMLLNELVEPIRFPFVLATFPAFKRLAFPPKSNASGRT